MNDGATCTVLLPNSAYIHQRKLKLLLSLKEGSQRGSRGFPGGSVGKESACNARDPSSIPGLERSAGKGIGYPVQYSCASLVAQLRKNLLARQEAWVPNASGGLTPLSPPSELQGMPVAIREQSGVLCFHSR